MELHTSQYTTLLLLLGLTTVIAVARNLEQPRYDTVYACEGKTLKIECNDGELIHLIRANYGRFSITICNDHGNTDWSVNCMSPKSLRVLHSRCSQQQNCSILASTSLFGDPCPGTLKYLEAHYQCMPASSTTTTSRPSPPWLTTSQPSVWSTGKSATLRPPPPQKSPSTLDGPPVTTTATSSVATQAPGSSSTRVPLPVVASEGASRQAVTETQPPPLGGMTTVTASTVTLAWKTTHRTTASSTAVFEYVPSPSVTWFQENDFLQLCSPMLARNLYWNWTRAGEVNVQPCPGGATGLARWRCVTQSPGRLSAPASGSGSMSSTSLPPVWLPHSPDLSECRSVWLTSLESRVEEGDSIISIANDLSQVTSSKTLYGGDMMTTTKIIKKMAQKMSVDIETFPDPRQREAIVTELLYGVVKTGSNLLDESQHPSWRDLSYKEQMRVATSLLMGLEENAFLLADTVIREKTVTQAVRNILLSVRVVETHNVAVEQFPSSSTLEQWPVSQDWLQLPRGALLENSEGGFVRLVFVAFDRLEEILQPQADPSTVVVVGENGEVTTGVRPSRNMTRVLNSKVISASLGKGRHIQLSEPVRLSLRHLRTENVSNPACVFWDYTMSAWSDEGCHVEMTNHTHTTCLCDHLTNFAVLMDVHATYLPPSHQMALQIITYIGCIISVVCLLLAVVTFQLFRSLKSDRTTIHKNLCVCLLVAEVLFLAGISQTDKPIVCGIVAGLLHFFFLCAFAWMFLEGFQLYVMLIEVFEAEKSRIRWYYIFAYGAPLIIVAVSCVVDPFSYGTHRYCWLRADNFFIFSFVGPVIAVILANLVFLSMAIYMMCRHANASASMKSKEHSRLASASGKEENALQNKLQSHLAWLRGAIVLVFLLGLTWTFGLLYLNEESVIMAYIFTVLNSLQGLFIFVFHCVQNEKVRKEYRKFIRRHAWLPKCLRCSKHSNGKERRSSMYAGSNGNPSAPNSHSTDSSALSPHGTSVGTSCAAPGLTLGPPLTHHHRQPHAPAPALAITSSYFLQRGWSSRSSHGKSSQVTAPAPGLIRANHRTSTSSRTATSNPSDQEVEVCVATLPYIRGRGIPPPNLPKSATTWGPLHKPLIWKNISFKSYSRDSGHGGSEQEDSPRSHNTTTLNSLNNLRSLNNSKDMRRQPYMPPDYQQGITNDLSVTEKGVGLSDSECVTHYCRDHEQEHPSVGQNGESSAPQQHGTRTAKKANNFLRSTSPWNHTYTEIREGRPQGHGHVLAHVHSHPHPDALPTGPPEDDPVYEEIEQSEIQVSDMSDEDGKRQSDVSRQSSRSYGDNHPLIPYSPVTDRNFHSYLDAAFKHRLKDHARYHPGLDRDLEEVDFNCLSPAGFPVPTDISRHPSNPNTYLYSSENARTVAVLDGETVVCHLQQPDHHDPYNSRTVVLPPYSEC
ncbi:latrophilin Cirl isoform X4 [Zootermopsis nevadensis]|nr:latrophilin Cirl isoform X4 [Zootermopsis nevadensis]XP_021940477.1 latrophilin Cirl isoform X4 [Zootermopsis nevadensis]XP_021940478.1 latrophilin Cirl isoform X4 [Zootermopsis nevadensis]XP_021940480.1 latrophilin Cirl isoform X4 [Zootermopsis nevadensis]XP_021940481.1 latrophilin Cirl isoform X4 [Zootermopsis nevadensis]XP_021940482.1 latrophilin Cirl isoform X4 [Zootermopsis nevadensis]XP_021940483.1 latrophilin Cirl isoform X4 [Zootermopsis nevadensis]